MFTIEKLRIFMHLELTCDNYSMEKVDNYVKTIFPLNKYVKLLEERINLISRNFEIELASSQQTWIYRRWPN